MNDTIFEAVKSAREFFNIKDFPGNFFDLLRNRNYTEEYKLLLFKEDIGKLSGFIGYGLNDTTIICINYKRSIGHQNFTLAHEIGHWFLHKGQSISDENVSVFSNDKIEKEASDFASEILYPIRDFTDDYKQIISNGLLNCNKRKELGKHVDMLCRKYCLSYEIILRKILFQNKQGAQYKIIRKEIENSLGGKISECFPKDFYVANPDLSEYQQLHKPYEILEQKVKNLLSSNKIGNATAESILLRNGIDIKY